MKRLTKNYSNKVNNFITFFKGLRANPLTLSYMIMALVVPFFLIIFQNCKATDLDTSSIDSGGSSPSDTNYDRGHIIRIDPETDAFIEDQLLPINTDIKMKFIKAHSDADNYKWTIKRGFNSIVTEDPTETDTYQTQFSQLGAYDVFANSYESETFLRTASKRFVAGQSCLLTDILEIELLSGSLTVDQSATFGLRYSDDFSSITWKATLPSGEFVDKVVEESTDDESTENQEDPNTLELSFEDESAGDLIIEVSASHVDRSGCLTYRKQNLNVTSTLRPHFNPIILTDGNNEMAVMLENNDIYKYLRPNGNQYLQMEVLHADTCSYQVNQDDKTDFTCNFGLVDISLDSDTSCGETVIELWASSSEDEQESEQERRTYYNYCPEDGNYCYLGLINERQSYHLCSVVIASENEERSAFEADPANGRCGGGNNACQIGNTQDLPDTDTHYKWQCVGIGGGDTVDCEKLIPIDGVCDNSVKNGCSAGEPNDEAIADTDTYYKWSCEGLHDGSTANNCQRRKPIDGVCNNSQRNDCTAGSSDDEAIADTDTHYRWHCVGLFGGITATNCQRALPPQPVNGTCDNSHRNSCSTGTANDAAISNTPTHYRWHCVGINGGTTAEGCQIAKPVNGVCNNSQRNSCSSGNPSDSAIADTSTHYRWHCVGINGGTTATDCQKALPPQPVNGVCNNSQRNSCSSGNPSDSAIADTSTHYRWHCVGINGGATVEDCRIAKPVNGVCNNSQRNSCSSGNPSDSAIADTSTHYRWHCVGLHGGATATNCQRALPPQPVNGTCDNSHRNSCSTGTANDAAISDTTTHYRWHCEGNNGGTAATNCQIEKPINGVCNNNQRNGCSVGNPSPISDTGTHHRWHCEGLHGGTIATNCQKAIPPDSVNGTCDNSIRNGCSAGTANDSAISDTNTYYRWHCEGLHGGTTVENCQVRKPINGVCNNSQRNGCSAGTLNDSAISDTSTHYRWHCEGLHGGTAAKNCQMVKPINGICDNTQRNSCTSGTSNDSVISDTSTHYRWHCEGLHGGSTARNCQMATPVNGVCDNSQRNSCSAGTLNDSAISDTTTYYRWHCVGSNGGSTARDCQIVKPVNGVCDNSQRNSCSAGTANDSAISDTSTLYKWHCVGRNGGTTATGCQKAIPIDGVCDNSQRSSCSAGTANDSAIADTSTLYKWHCVGSNGGSTATDCQKAIPISGVCNNAVRNGCASGTPNDAAAEDTSAYYKWYCLGSNGGSTARDCQKARPVDGVCDNSQRNSCSAGTPNSSAIADTATHHKWHCEGLHGGNTATDCERIRSVDGVCNNSRVNGCSNGTLKNIEDTDTQYKWQCVGLNGGRTLTCSKSKADCSFNKYFCDEGSPEDLSEGSPVPPVPESGEATHYTWTCVSADRKAVASCRTLKQTAYCGGNVTFNETADQYLIDINTCLTGTPINITETEDLHKWQCDWYESIASCRAAKHGQCRPSSPKLCNDSATRTSYNSKADTWRCAGGTSSADCSR